MPESLCHSLTLRIRGTVQGVGFRPFVYRLAVQLGITGEVSNDADGVLISAFGSPEALERFRVLIREAAPPLSKVRSVEEAPGPQIDAPAAFAIVASGRSGSPEVDIPADTAVCEACLAEMRDPDDRRHDHAFINCTDCGPRYTVITALPYDRPNTSMAGFPLCPECEAEYTDPASRRFHAQPTCCPRCGPRFSLLDENGVSLECAHPIVAGIQALRAGRILAVKGIGGFHLACRADDADAVARLRERKGREEKPFAIMVRDRQTALEIAECSADELRLLESPERPIVLVSKRRSRVVAMAEELAPGLPNWGIMLPYAPIHHLLFDKSEFAALVMTSANRTDEPMVHADGEARDALSGIADAFLTHDRPIQVRTDDSIARIVAGAPVLLRRGRGFVPESLPAPVDLSGIVGLGGVLKSTVAVGRGRSCIVSQFIGNAESLETLRQIEGVKDHLCSLLGTTPKLYALDLHPDTPVRFIPEPGIPQVRIQHHHAHAAACLAENGIEGKAVCVVYDGTGYGDDGTMWGGEIFIADNFRFTRAGHLAPLLLPGGEAAIVHPWRAALGALFSLLGTECENLLPSIPAEEKRPVLELLAKQIACIPSSGMGRLFDGASALLGVCQRRSYEGQPAILLEAVADATANDAYAPQVSTGSGGSVIIDGAKIMLEALADLRKGTAVPVIAGRFHETIARATVIASGIVAANNGTDRVALSGGCFQNALLLGRTTALLREKGLLPILHRLVPPNDESVSYGQAVIAGITLRG